MDPLDLPSIIAAQLQTVMNRGDKPLSQAELARQSGIPQPTISRILKGEANTQVETLWSLANTLGVTLNDLAYSGNLAPAPTSRNRSDVRQIASTTSALQQSVIDAFQKLVTTRRISDSECIAVLGQWADRLDAPAES